MKDSNLVLMTTAEAKPGKETVVQKALRDVAKAARAQSGCIEYSVLRSTENPAVTVNFERWASKSERDTFLASADVEGFVRPYQARLLNHRNQYYTRYWIKCSLVGKKNGRLAYFACLPFIS